MQYKNIEITCLFCGQEFTWTPGEQTFLQALIDDGKKNPDGSDITFTQPKRCRDCRMKKKQERLAREQRDNY